MNRQQKRKQERNLAWVNSLSKEKQEIINSVVESRAADISLSNIINFQTGMLAAITIKAENIFNYNDLQEIMVLGNALSKNNKLKEEYREEWMFMLDDLRPELVNKIEELFEKGVTSQARIVGEVKKIKKFSKIANKDIVLIFKEVKDSKSGLKIKDPDETKYDVDQALKYIFSDEKKVETGKQPNDKNTLSEKITKQDIVCVDKETKITSVLEGKLSKFVADIELLNKKRDDINLEIESSLDKSNQLNEAIKILRNLDM
ncbi:MAG: hypothetical protein ACRC1T_11845 [Clostridium chrysemydis]|uniref:hypothetical protein n=1 Tax=Clostridium chrysemydis TaxID=2665504 RepID=UPI003F3B7114